MGLDLTTRVDRICLCLFIADFRGWEGSAEIMGDFLFLLPSASGTSSAKTALPFPLSRNSVVEVVEGLATLLARTGGEGRLTGIGPVEGGGATGRSKVWSPKTSQVRALGRQMCFKTWGSSYLMLCQSGQTWGVMLQMRISSLEHKSTRPGKGPSPYSLTT